MVKNKMPSPSVQRKLEIITAFDIYSLEWSESILNVVVNAG
jgi:hypothetical protein